MKHLPVALISLAALAACSEPPPPPAPPPAPKAAPTVSLAAPTGTYAIDPNHHNLDFSVVHLGLAPYVMRFAAVEATLQLDAANLSNSKITVKADPLSLRTNFAGDYKATHKGTPWSSFDEALARDAKFLNAGEHKEITFESTGVTVSGSNRLKVTGELAMRGQSHPVTLDVELSGSMAEHPWTKKGAIGFSATGSFKRSAYGMDHNLQFISDDVSLAFNGEFHQQEAAAPAEVPADDPAEADKNH